MGLVEFLQARFDDEEKLVRDLLVDAQSTSLMLQEPKLLGKCIPGWHDWPRVERMCAARLAEVDAKRELVRLHGRMSIDPGHPYFNDAHLTREPMVLCRSCEPERMWRRERSWPCRTLKTIALLYVAHADYRREWRP